MAELIDKGALVNLLTNDINMTIEFMNNNGADKYNGGFDRLFGQLNALKSYKGIVEDMPTTSDAEIRAKVISEMRDKLIIHFSECQTETDYTFIKQILTNVCEDIGEIAEQMKERE